VALKVVFTNGVVAISSRSTRWEIWPVDEKPHPWQRILLMRGEKEVIAELNSRDVSGILYEGVD